MHFVLISAQLLGDTKTVLAEADKLDKLLTNEVATAIPIAQPVKAAPYFAWAQYADPDTILAMPDPPGAAAICEGDVALCTRHRVRRQEGCCRGARRG